VTTVPVARLLEIMAKLRDPEDGCPWDLEQDFRSIAPYTLEEAYEVADAIERGDLGDLQEELGDLLLQVVFHAQMAREMGAFGFEDVVAGICNKLVRRHPHVFAGATVESAAAQTESWERLKAEEKAARGRAGALDDVPVALPALTRAAKLGRRAARVGFDWPDATGPRRKVDEELQELDSAIAGDEDPDAVEAEFGDLLFALVNYARHLGIDPESALRRSNEKFVRRFGQVEERAAVSGTALEEAGLERLDGWWEEAKRKEREP
jgi:MazG family protein